jgi:ribonucleotide reductase alpha subunit
MNIFMKTTSGSMKVAKYNKHLVRHAKELGIWSEDFANRIAANSGALPAGLDKSFRDIYLTAYEISNAERIKRAAMRGAFIDQTQSFNIFLNPKTPERIRGVISLGFKYRLKTIAYYVRTIEEDKKKLGNDLEAALKDDPPVAEPVAEVCSRDNPDCVSCQG